MKKRKDSDGCQYRNMAHSISQSMIMGEEAREGLLKERKSSVLRERNSNVDNSDIFIALY